MPTIRTVTVKSSGGDYSSLAAAEAGVQEDRVSADRKTIIECYAFTDSTAVTIDGSTDDATRNLEIRCAAGEGHSGYFDASKYVLTRTLTPNDSYLLVEGLQINPDWHGINNADSHLIVNRCIIKYRAGAGFGIIDNVGGLSVRNSVIQGFLYYAGFRTYGTAVIYNCVLFANKYGAETYGTPLTVKNTYVANNSAGEYGYGTINRTACAHASSSVISGSTASIAYSTANFTNVTSGSEDFHLQSGASATLLSGGADLSGIFTDDIDGETRGVPYSIGADQIAPTSATAVASPGSVTISGFTAAASTASTATPSPGSVTITGSNAAPLTASTITAATGTITITGSPVAALTANTITATPSTVTITGSPATATVANVATPSLGSVTITGSNATTSSGSLATVSPGMVTISGEAITARTASTATVIPGSVTITGVDVTGGSVAVATASPGTVTITGANVTTTVGSSAVASPGVVTITGANVLAASASTAIVIQGVVTITGVNATINTGNSDLIVIGHVPVKAFGTTAAAVRCVGTAAVAQTLHGERV